MSTAKRAMEAKRRAEEEAPWDEYESAFNDLADDIDTLRACIENNQASLECFRGDISVRDVYQRVCIEIQREEEELQELESFVNDGENSVNKIKVRGAHIRVTAARGQHAYEWFYERNRGTPS